MGNDPPLLERVIFAFGLLEAISKVGLPFCFKGGTSLMLLLGTPQRLSTDIDIIVEPGIDIDRYIREAGNIFPFKEVSENIRFSKNNVEKRHFRFKYCSPKSGRDVTILLDVLFEKLQYERVEKMPIENEFLLTEGKNLSVCIPNANGILGDKLTAFAPHTTGIPFGISKELEIIKQLFDCGVLFDSITDFKEVSETYRRVATLESGYRGLTLSLEDVLKDTIESCLCIASRGILYKDDYSYYREGILRIRSHIIGGKFSGEIAGAYASKVLYLASALFTKQKDLIKISDSSEYFKQLPKCNKPKAFSYLKTVDLLSYGYLIEAALPGIME